RARLGGAERELAAAKETLRTLRVQQDTLAGPYVAKRLARLQSALTADPLDVPNANAALKEAVRKITMDPEAATLTIQWRHTNQAGAPLMFHSRHSKVFGATASHRIAA